jgi:hypothetical protein
MLSDLIVPLVVLDDAQYLLLAWISTESVDKWPNKLGGGSAKPRQLWLGVLYLT